MSTMASGRNWEIVFERRREDLAVLLQTLHRRAKTNGLSSLILFSLEDAVSLKDFEAFEAAVHRLAQQSASKKVTLGFDKYVYPHLEHLRYFTQALSAVAQADRSASLCLGVLLVLIQAGCLFSESLEEILEQLAALQKLLPGFESDVARYPTNQSVRLDLLVILEDYLDYCIVIVRNLARNPFARFMRNIVSSTIRRDLKRLTQKIQSDVRTFESSVTRAERQRAKSADERLASLHLASASKVSTTASSPTFPIFGVNIAENLDFMGRQAELNSLQEQLIVNHQSARPFSCVIHGIGGIGKTQTALKFVYEYRSSFEAIFWVSADPEKKTEILRTFGAIGRKLKLFDSEDIDRVHVEQVLDWLQNTERCWLLVFDNVVDWNSVSLYWPNSSKRSSAVIVTSQKIASWTNAQLPLEPFDPVEGSNLLLHSFKLDDIDSKDPVRSLACDISEELGGSPLSLNAVHGFMSLSGCSFADCLETIRTRSMMLGANTSSTWRYERASTATHDIVLKQLSRPAKDLLYMIAFMSADNINEDLLLRNHTHKDLNFLADKPTYLSIIAELAESRLVQREAGGEKVYLSTHRATQQAMLQKLNENPELRNVAFQRTVKLLRENFPPLSKLQIADAQVWPLILKVLPHLQSALTAFERAWPTLKGSFLFAEILIEVGGMDLYDRGLISESYKFSKKAQEILDSLDYPIETPLRGDALTITGICCDVMNIDKRSEGLQVREECLRVRQACFEKIPPNEVTIEDRIRLQNSYTDLVDAMQQVNDYQAIYETINLCLKQYKKWGDEDTIPYEYGKYYNHRSYLQLYEGKTELALQDAKKGFELFMKATPGAHIALLFKFSWANMLFQHGDIDGAINEHKDLLEQRKKEYGNTNIRTSQSRLNLGIIYYKAGNLDEAEKQLRSTLELRDKQMLWPIQNLTRAKYYLSQVLKKQNPSDSAAVKMETEALETLEELLVQESSGKATVYQGNYPLLFDYLVPYNCRLFTPRGKIRRASNEGDDMPNISQEKTKSESPF